MSWRPWGGAQSNRDGNVLGQQLCSASPRCPLTGLLPWSGWDSRSVRQGAGVRACSVCLSGCCSFQIMGVQVPSRAPLLSIQGAGSCCCPTGRGLSPQRR